MQKKAEHSPYTFFTLLLKVSHAIALWNPIFSGTVLVVICRTVTTAIYFQREKYSELNIAPKKINKKQTKTQKLCRTPSWKHFYILMIL